MSDHWTHMRSKIACQNEIQYLWDREVYEYSTEAESRTRTGHPIDLKWVAANKSSDRAPHYRSHLVQSKVRHKRVEQIFSAAPPLETLPVLLCVACQEDVFHVEDPFCSGNCKKTMYGTLETAAGGFSRIVASPCHFFHEACNPTSWCTVMISSKWAEVTGKTCTEFVAWYNAVCKSGLGVVTGSHNQLLGQNIDISTVVNQVRARPATFLACLKALGPNVRV